MHFLSVFLVVASVLFFSMGEFFEVIETEFYGIIIIFVLKGKKIKKYVKCLISLSCIEFIIYCCYVVIVIQAWLGIYYYWLSQSEIY